MAEKKIKWTEQQRRAITQRGSDVLVTASAGTGKTAVLSGRCVDIVSDKSGRGNVLGMLVLTFTNAAAEQMRSRIAQQLKTAFQQSRDPHLRCQLVLLDGADIGTIHSFCKRIITEHFYKLGLDPTFRVIESDEQKLLKAEVLDATIDWAWQQSNLVQGLEQLLYRRDLHTNDGFLAKIIALSNFLDGIISRENWYQRAIQLAEAVNPFASGLGEKQKQVVAEKLRHILERIRYARKLYENENAGGDWPAKWEDGFVKPVVKCIELLEAGDWNKCAEEIRNFDKPKVNKPGELPETIAAPIRRTVKKAVDAFEKLSDLAIVNPDYLDKVGGAVSRQTRILIELVRKFDRLYSQAKQAVNCLDFADLEHYALKLLTDDNSPEDNQLPSETALMLRRKYEYIFVDEYQDINPVQQAILDLLGSADNIFVVGDVKQSIYGFRGAKSDAFIDRLKSASADPANAPKGLRVDLNANFRSAKGILDFVNKIFGRIMTASFAKIDYDESAKLKPASKEKAISSTGTIVELHILDEPGSRTGKSGDNENTNHDTIVISSRQRQAAMIARRIRRMVGTETGKAEFQIYDRRQDKVRDVEYRDIAILMRSPAKKVNDYLEVLQLAGVPVSCEAAAGYFEKTEISDCLCLLKILDNPQRDIELAAVLRSWFFKIGDTELAQVKVHSGMGTADSTDDADLESIDEHYKNYYDCVLEYCESGPDAKLAEKLEKALEQIEQWRTLARLGNLADLIWQIYRETGFLSFVLALPNGRQRRANLLKLHDRAIQFEGFASSSGIPSLKRFVEFIEKLQEAGQDWAPAEPQAAAENAVRIISVHKSKGLEFPVVFLAELGSQFNKRELQADCLCSAADTLGLQIIDRGSNSRLSSLAHQVIAEEKLSAGLAEEMRILYVATTRARDRLILTACEKKNTCRDTISSGFFFGEKPIADWQLRSCRSPLEWILCGLCDSKSLHEAFETGLAEKCGDDDLFSLRLYSQAELGRLCDFINKLKTNKSRSAARRPGDELAASAEKKLYPERTEPRLLAQVRKSLAWRYRFGDVPLLPAKQSVTQLTHHDDEYVKIDYSAALDRKPRAVLSADLVWLLDSRLIGTATHLLIARLDLARPVTGKTIKETKEKLLADGAVTEAVAESINTSSIITFFESELGRAALDAGNGVWREWPFTFALPASFVDCDSSPVARVTAVRRPEEGHEPRVTDGETVIVQGIIDMLVQTPKGVLIIDFKADNITANQVADRAEFYREQLELYGRAAAAILKTEITGKWLYFLAPGQAVKV